MIVVWNVASFLEKPLDEVRCSLERSVGVEEGRTAPDRGLGARQSSAAVSVERVGTFGRARWEKVLQHTAFGGSWALMSWLAISFC